jgi:hypothetical protein
MLIQAALTSPVAKPRSPTVIERRMRSALIPALMLISQPRRQGHRAFGVA